MMKTRKHKGLLSIELVVSLGVLATLGGVLMTLNIAFGKANQKLWMRHTCFAAGAAQADAIATTGKPIDPEKFKSLWPDVDCQISMQPGTGQWEGLTHLQLLMSAEKKKQTVRVELSERNHEDKTPRIRFA
ncbi:MAG: hypothetical protein ACYTET_06925 [Planctomycetota bacterium]|jgi:hypothetical protein